MRAPFASSPMHDYTGIIHFHSDYSHDGRVGIDAIVDAARSNKIDVLMLTDHDCLEARGAGQEGWHRAGRKRPVLLIAGEEICPSQHNHYLAFGLEWPVGPNTGPDNIQSMIDRINSQNGIGIIAHPDHEGNAMFHVKQFAWKDWSVTGFTGIGIWDFMTDWQSSLTSYFKAVISYFFPAWVLKGPVKKTLERWDSLTRSSRITGIGELDNHDTPYDILGITLSVFPFRRAFRYIRTHFLLEEAFRGENGHDISAVYEALRKGRVYVALDYFAPANGFSFRVFAGGSVYYSGDEFALQGSARFEASIPQTGKLILLRDGMPIKEVSGEYLELEVRETGTYRIEAFKRKLGQYRPWIFSNPIYII